MKDDCCIAKESEPVDLTTERRRQIIEAALRCFRERGFHLTTLRDIAQEFGMSVGHIYNYFSSKDAIIEALVVQYTDRFLERLVRGGDCSKQSPEKVRRYFEELVDVYMNIDASRLAISVMNEALIKERIYEITVQESKKVRNHLLQLCEKKSNSANIDSSVIQAKILTFCAFLDGMRLAVLFNPDVDRRVLRDAAVERLIQMMEADQASSRARSDT